MNDAVQRATQVAHNYMATCDNTGIPYTLREVSAVSGLPVAAASFVLNWHRRTFTHHGIFGGR